MIKQQDVINKANEDFVKFKARLMHLGKEQIFQQSDKINFAKKFRRVLAADNMIIDNISSLKIIDMENVYDVFYNFYKEKYDFLSEDLSFDHFLMSTLLKYELR